MALVDDVSARSKIQQMKMRFDDRKHPQAQEKAS